MSSCDVLSIDDEEDFRATLGVLLTLEGLRFAEAASGAQAIEMLLGGLEPAVVLIDFRMPGISGPETLDRMRAHGFNMPAVLMSADRQATDRARQQGFAEALLKPFDPDKLLAIIRPLVTFDPSGPGAGEPRKISDAF